MNAPRTYWQVTNWRTYQHYAESRFERPPWIKFYSASLDSPDLLELSIAGRLLANLLLLVAAKTGNRMPNDPKTLAKLVHMSPQSVRKELTMLEKIGFIERVQLTEHEHEMAQNGQIRLIDSRPDDPEQSRPRARGHVSREAEAEQSTALRSQRQSSTRPRANSLPPDENLLTKLAEITGATGGEIGVIRAHLRSATDAEIGRTIEAIHTGGTNIRNRPGYAVEMLKKLRAERTATDDGEPDL